LGKAVGGNFNASTAAAKCEASGDIG